MKSMVRVEEAGTTLIAYLGDGSQWTFDGTLGVSTSRGAYSWYLSAVTTVLGRTTSYSYTQNASGRLVLRLEFDGGLDAAGAEMGQIKETFVQLSPGGMTVSAEPVEDER